MTSTPKEQATTILPKKGFAPAELTAALEEARSHDAQWKKGRTWSLVYYVNEEHERLLEKASTMFLYANGLSPGVFPSLRQFETEVIAMARKLLNGGPDSCGSMTSGGTESILLAVKSYRDRARTERPQIKEPEILLPVSAHPAFEKAAHYFGIKVIHIPLRPDLRANPKALQNAITDNAIMAVGSAPGYPHGVIDPIEEMAAIARERGLGFHADACLGGFLLPFARQIGYPVPAFDFEVPGVTSISADIHKYGFGARGASTVLYRNIALHRYQYYVYTDWPGGIYATPTMAGSRPGGPIAAAWATLMSLGENGYCHLAKTIMETTRTLINGINAIPGLSVMGNPDMSVFAFTSDKINVYALADLMEAQGWHLERQQFPPSLHLMVTPAHAAVTNDFLRDLKSAVTQATVNGQPAPESSAALYGMAAGLPDRGQVKNFILNYMDNLYKAPESIKNQGLRK
ncbi:MAG: aspartate aminotransferase family protein [Elusimicrobia bacterium]|nr:aspartate aminotransferase family protein [Elusimicrobiota bacterium]